MLHYLVEVQSLTFSVAFEGLKEHQSQRTHMITHEHTYIPNFGSSNLRSGSAASKLIIIRSATSTCSSLSTRCIARVVCLVFLESSQQQLQFLAVCAVLEYFWQPAVALNNRLTSCQQQLGYLELQAVAHVQCSAAAVAWDLRGVQSPRTPPI